MERQRAARDPANTSVTVAYVGSRGDHLQRQRDTNPVTPRTLPDGTVMYGSRSGSQTISNARVNPQFGALVSGIPSPSPITSRSRWR